MRPKYVVVDANAQHPLYLTADGVQDRARKFSTSEAANIIRLQAAKRHPNRWLIVNQIGTATRKEQRQS
ncbi:hypothetical protein LCGC14_1670310 [marine sediment metagenome]|uniref:Uncharacterized protein n=1 Tax=marine sediment metagenome TaxID=412755 RepID=A0A0F9HRG9_9ZZZZ